MARAVLASPQILSAIFAIAIFGFAGGSKPHVNQNFSILRAEASPSDAKAIQDFRNRVESGPFYQNSPNLQAEVSPSDAKAIQNFRNRMESGPFYAAMVRHLGKPQSCQNKKDQQELDVTCEFRQNGRLQVRTNSAIEFSEQRIDLPHISAKSALALLKAAEKHSYGAGGCGIAWDRPTTESKGQPASSREVVYRGDVCNCQASILYNHNSVVALLLRTAC